MANIKEQVVVYKDELYVKGIGGVKNLQDLKDKKSLQKVVNEGGGYTPPAGGIPKTDLSSEVQTSLNKADNAYSKPPTGIPASDLSSDVQEAINAAKPNVLISTIHIEQGITDDFIQITGDVAVNVDNSGNIIYSAVSSDGKFGIPSHKSPTTNVFSWIRENTKCVHAIWNKTYSRFKYIDKTKSNNSDDALNGLKGSFIIIPAFYWKCENIDANHSTVKVAKDYPGEGWNYYDGKYAIPQYKVTGVGGAQGGEQTTVDAGVALYDTLNHGYGSLSFPDTPAVYISHQASVALSRIIGEGWSLINYDIHKLMILLCLGYYGRIDVRNYIGKAGQHENTYAYNPLDLTSDVSFEDPDNARKIFDSIGSENPDNTVVWGIVDWYNNVYEWVDDLMNLGQTNYLEDAPAFNYVNAVAIVDTKLNYDRDNYHYELEKKVKRVIATYTDDDNDVYFGSNAILGKEFDVMASGDSQIVDSDSDVYGWSCYFFASGDAGGVAGRSCDVCVSGAGLANLIVLVGAGNASDSYGLRLLYHGTMVEVTNPDYFNN